MASALFLIAALASGFLMVNLKPLLRQVDPCQYPRR
jgi:hypothetical protein